VRGVAVGVMMRMAMCRRMVAVAVDVNARIVVLVLRNVPRNVQRAGFNLKRDGRMLKSTKIERSQNESDPCNPLAQVTVSQMHARP
jgi:hypothetical protein